MNLKLSQTRAEAVRTSLVARGATADALTAHGHGETQPIADNALQDGRSANRRITFKWLEERQGDG